MGVKKWRPRPYLAVVAQAPGGNPGWKRPVVVGLLELLARMHDGLLFREWQQANLLAVIGSPWWTQRPERVMLSFTDYRVRERFMRQLRRQGWTVEAWHRREVAGTDRPARFDAPPRRMYAENDEKTAP